MFKILTLLPLFYLFLSGCSADEPTIPDLNSYEVAELITPSGTVFKVYLAKTPQQRKLGLSGVSRDDFDEKMGMLFLYETVGERQFWMPETYFDMDVFFLDEGFRVTDTHRRLKHFPYKASRGEVPRSKSALAHYVLELKSASSLAIQLKQGMQLTVKGEL